MNPNDETRVPPPVPPTLSQAPDGLTPTFIPNNATAAQTPEQISSLLAASDRDPSPVVPGYEVLSKLGAGGMGVVYRARELAFDRDVAVKVLKVKYPQHSPILRRFLEEARITAQLQHPAIPPVHHIGELADGRPFLAMKLIKGDTLVDLLANAGAVRPRFMPAFAQVCQAVAYAHAHKVIHRDLKPHNIMVGAFGEVQVMDWGLAKVLGTPEPAGTEPSVEGSTEIRAGRDPDSETQAGSVLGTPAYMAPEQAAGEVDKIDERVDVFGLGAVLCALLTGDPPYTGSGKDSVRVKAIRCETADAFARLDASGADAELVTLCKACLNADRDDRPRNAGEVAQAVSAHLAAVEERARQTEIERARAEERRKKRRVQWALAAAVLLLLASGGVGAVFAHLWRGAEDARIEADNQRGIAEGARADAEHLQRLAEEAQKGEVSARKEVENEREKLATFEYGRTMQVIHQEWRENSFFTMREVLNGVSPRLRGWEWHYLNRVCEGSDLTLKGHTDGVTAVSFSPDGARIATGSSDKTVRVWDARLGREMLVLKHKDVVNAVAFSPDGTRLVTASGSLFPADAPGGVKVWDAKTGTESLVLKGRTGSVTVATFSADGKHILTASDNVRLWDAKTGDEVLTFKTGRVNAAAISSDGDRIVTAHQDRTARVWDGKTGKEVLALQGHTEAVRAVGFSTDGSHIVTGVGMSLRRGEARVWNAKTGAEVISLKGHTTGVYAAAFSPDGSRIVTAGGEPTKPCLARVWDAKTGAELLTLRGHTQPVIAAAFNPDGTRIVTGSWDNTVRVWNVQHATEAMVLRGHWNSVFTAQFSPDGTHIITGSSDKTARVWDAMTGTELVTITRAEMVRAAAFSPDGTRIVVGVMGGFGKAGETRVWDPKTGTEVFALNSTDSVSAATWSSTGKFILTGGDEGANRGVARLWDAQTGAELLTLRGQNAAVTAVAISADGARVATASRDHTARVWDTKTGAEILTLKGHKSDVVAIAFSRDDTLIVTGSFDATARVWDAKTGAEIRTLKGHTSTVSAVTWNPDGTRIATGGIDHTARVWDAKTGAEVLILKGHTDSVFTASFSPDGTKIVTGGRDLSVRVWDAGRGAVVTPIPLRAK